MEVNVREQVVLKQPRTLEARWEAAGILVDRLKYRMPLAIDGLDGAAEKAYAAWPERVYLIGTDGRVLYKGGLGPFDFHPDEAAQKLAAVVGGPTT